MVLNEEISKFLEEHYGDLFETHGCYEYVLKLIIGEVPELSRNNMKALFCYAYDGIYYFCHAFCVVKGEVIEPLGNVRKSLEIDKLIPICELTFKEYADLILKDKKYDLSLSLFSQEMKVINENKEEMAKINSIEANTIVTRLTKTTDDTLLILQSLLSGKGISEKYMKLRQHNYKPNSKTVL